MSPIIINTGSAFSSGGKGASLILFTIAISSSFAMEENFYLNPLLYICSFIAIYILFSDRVIEVMDSNIGIFKITVGIKNFRLGKSYEIKDFKCGVIKSGRYVTKLKQSIGQVGGEFSSSSTNEFLITLYLIPKSGERLKLFQGKEDVLKEIIQYLLTPTNFKIYKEHIKNENLIKFKN